MGLLDIIRHNKIKEPIFFNEHEDNRLTILEDLLNKVGDDQKELILNQMNLIKMGLAGEKSVIYELMHSKEPFVFLHDISLPNVMTDSQIDFIVITRKAIFVLETKSLIGDVKIDNEGNFIRYFKNSKGEVYKKEGIYSPITQNKYHINAIQEILSFKNLYKFIPMISLVVITNPKAIINKTYAKKEVKNQVVKHDQLNNIIKEKTKTINEIDLSDKQILEIAELLLSNDTKKIYNFVEKLKLKIIEEPIKINDAFKNEKTSQEQISNDALYETLRSYRLKKSKELNIDPYIVFSDEVLKNLILNKPKTKEEFIAIHGLSENKYNFFGNDVIQILHPDQMIDNSNEIKLCPEEQTTLNNDLKQFRIMKSKEENVPLYFIYNNEQMDDLIKSMPKTKEELKKVKGFGDVKVEKYGAELIDILNKYR